MKENIPYCTKCDLEMKEVIVPKYEFEEGLPLLNVPAYKCKKCKKIFFTEKQSKQMELRTKGLRDCTFAFERKITYSGKSLTINIPHELITHLDLKQGQKIKIFPIAKEGFLIRKFK